MAESATIFYLAKSMHGLYPRDYEDNIVIFTISHIGKMCIEVMRLVIAAFWCEIPIMILMLEQSEPDAKMVANFIIDTICT